MPDKKDKYAQLQQVIAELKDQPGALMPVLQKAQGIFGCVPMDVQKPQSHLVKTFFRKMPYCTSRGLL